MIAKLAIEKGIEASIVYASTKSIADKAYGSMLLGIPKDEAIIKNTIEYLTNIPNVIAQEEDANV